jgi:hypothetical protein
MPLHHADKRAIRRVKSSVTRVEAQPYDFAPTRRLPRLGGAASVLWCVPSASIAGGTLPPSGAPGGPLSGQTIYRVVNGKYVALATTFDLYNPRTAATTAGKLTAVTPNGDGSFSVVDWDC